MRAANIVIILSLLLSTAWPAMAQPPDCVPCQMTPIPTSTVDILPTKKATSTPIDTPTPIDTATPTPTINWTATYTAYLSEFEEELKIYMGGGYTGTITPSPTYTPWATPYFHTPTPGITSTRFWEGGEWQDWLTPSVTPWTRVAYTPTGTLTATWTPTAFPTHTPTISATPTFPSIITNSTAMSSLQVLLTPVFSDPGYIITGALEVPDILATITISRGIVNEAGGNWRGSIGVYASWADAITGTIKYWEDGDQAITLQTAPPDWMPIVPRGYADIMYTVLQEGNAQQSAGFLYGMINFMTFLGILFTLPFSLIKSAYVFSFKLGYFGMFFLWVLFISPFVISNRVLIQLALLGKWIWGHIMNLIYFTVEALKLLLMIIEALDNIIIIFALLGFLGSICAICAIPGPQPF